MKKIFQLVVVGCMLSFINVSAANSIVITDLGNQGVRVTPSTSGKIYYQWIKLTDEMKKSIKTINNEITKNNSSLEDAKKELSKIQKVEEKLNRAQSELSELKNEKIQIENEYSAKIANKNAEIKRENQNYDQELSCFNDSGCMSQYNSIEEIKSNHNDKIKSLEQELAILENGKETNLATISNKIDVKNNDINTYKKQISGKATLENQIQSYMTKLFQLKNNYYEVIKYNDDNWIETDDQIIEKPTSDTEEDYVLWVMLVTDDGDTTYASQEFKSIKSSEKSVSSKETNSEVNPKTSDKGLIYGGGFILTAATIIAVRKKIKMLGI